jgi:hypothetical protein
MAATRYGGWGIYFDEGSSGIVAGQRVYRTTHGGTHQHYGETNVLTATSLRLAATRSSARARTSLGFTFVTNIVASAQRRLQRQLVRR